MEWDRASQHSFKISHFLARALISGYWGREGELEDLSVKFSRSDIQKVQTCSEVVITLL